MKKKIIPVLILAVVAAAIFAARSWLRKDNGGLVRVSGNIELTEVNLSFKLAGRLAERAVDEGDRVKKGMIVARLDKEQLLRQSDRARAAVESADSLRMQQSSTIDLQAETLEAQIQQRAAEVKAAQSRLSELLAGSRAQEKQQARAAVERAQTEYQRSANDWKRAQTLFKNEDISAADYDQYRTRFETAEAQRKTAREQLSLVLEGPRQEDIQTARAQLAQSQAAFRMAQAQRIELKRRRQEMGMRIADVAQRKADVAVLNTQLADSDIASPIDGVVLVKSGEPGEVLAAGTTVLTVGDIEHPWLRAYIGERDLGRVKLGDKAKVTTDSFPGKTYWGRVSFISAEAEFTPKQIQTTEERVKLMYRIKIELENPRGELKSNMPADAEILVSDAK
jgi:HlyD family secretion protein